MFVKWIRRLLAVLLSVAMTVALLPAADFGGTAKAGSEAPSKTVSGLCVYGIKAPVISHSDGWPGSYVYFGRYDGTPVLYRVLAPKTNIYGSNTMFLDCDCVLFKSSYDEDGKANKGASSPAEWEYSDIRAKLNGSEFFTKDNGFSAVERSAVAKSTIASRPTDNNSFVEYQGLNEKVFLLDVEDILNENYGYNWVYALAKKTRTGDDAIWYLRTQSARTPGKVGYISTYGGLYDYGYVESIGYSALIGASPAFNISHSYIIFNSLIRGQAGQPGATYKLTIADGSMAAYVPYGKKITISGNKVTVPYAISGSDAPNVNRLSVVILDKEYKAGNTNSAKIKYYCALNTTIAETGEGTFTLPSSLPASGWGTDYQVYLLAEDVNDPDESDYASVPFKLEKPGTVSKAVTITTQPKNKTVEEGTQAAFTVAAEGVGTLTYQWQTKAPNSTSWKDSTNATAKKATFKITAQSGHNGYQIRCVVKDGNGKELISKAATLKVKSGPKITTQPKDAKVKIGEDATFKVAATGEGTLKYQWQTKAPGAADWKNASGTAATKATYTITVQEAHCGYQFRCVVTDSKGISKESNAATLTTKPTITMNPSDAKVLVGGTARFAVAAEGKKPFTYQWQVKASNSSEWKNSTNGTAKKDLFVITAGAAHDNCAVRCLIKDSDGNTVISNYATIKIWDGQIRYGNFPNDTFLEYLETKIDKDENGYLSCGEIAVTTSIDLWLTGITSLKGIEYFTELRELYCSDNKLTSLDVRGNVLLETLSCENNQGMFALNVSHNPYLSYLNCSNGSLRSLDVSTCRKLELLYCEDNQISKLDLSKNALLEDLNCSRIGLTRLDVSKNTKLIWLVCDGNGMSTLNVSGAKNLTYITCRSNLLTTINITKNTKLQSLVCDENKLKSIDLSKSTALEYLSCLDNQITKLDASNTNLEELVVDIGVTVTGVKSTTWIYYR